MKYASLAKIIEFDNIYAGSLYEEKMTEIVGTHLPIEFKRYMGKEYNKYYNGLLDIVDNSEKMQDTNEELSNYKEANLIPNPRKHSFILQFLWFIYKTIRILYVSWIFYFTPFLILFANFEY